VSDCPRQPGKNNDFPEADRCVEQSMRSNRPWAPILLASATWIFFLFVLGHGLIVGKIPVLLFRMEYGAASYATHPLWYVFGVGEWCFLLGISAFFIWRLWKNDAHHFDPSK
jgi:hypothetical protein